MLSREQLDAALLNAQHNFAWMTGGGSNGIDLSRENGAASLLITRQGERFILANNIEMPRMLAEEISAADFEPVEISWQHEKVSDAMLKKAQTLAANGAIATDIAMFAGSRSIENKVAACRYQLTPQELVRIRELGRDAGVALRNVIGKLEPGETELAVAEKMRRELSLNEIASVVTLVAADERIGRFRHPIPSKKVWEKTLLMVTCAKRHGLIVSLSRIVCLGGVPAELRQKTEAAAFVNAIILAATRTGATGAEVYAAAAQGYAEKGLENEINRHHQGGAAGYRTREWVAHPRSTEVVHVNQAFAWNPSITGTKVEETCITTGDGVEIITASPDFPQIVTNLNGRQYFSPGVLSI